MQWGYNYCIYTPRILLVIVSFTISDIFEQKMYKNQSVFNLNVLNVVHESGKAQWHS